jgi:hypothetical protein
MTEFEIIDGIDPLPFQEGPGPRLIDDSKPIERMKQGLLSGEYKTISQAAKAQSECTKGASPVSTMKRLTRKFKAAVRADVMSLWLRYYNLMFPLWLWERDL